MFRILFLCALCASFNVSAQRFLFENVSVNEGLPSSKVYCTAEDNAGVIWIGTDAGLARYDGATTVYTEKDGMAPNGVKSIFIDENNDVWAGHLGGGLSCVINRRPLNVKPKVPFTFDVTGIESNGKGGVYVATLGAGFWEYEGLNTDGSLNSERRLEVGSTNIYGLGKLKDQVVFFIDGGVFGLNESEKAERLVFKDVPVNYPIISLAESSDGSVWLGTNNGGAYEVRKGKSTVHFDQSNGLPGSIVMCFAEGANNEMWIGTWDGGLARVEQNGVRSYTTSNGMHGNTIRSLLFDREDVLIVGTNENGIDIYKGERFLHFGSTDNLIDPHVWAGMEDDKGNLWFGTNGGLTMLRKAGTTISFSADKNGLSSDKVRCMVQTENGRIWIGTEGGGLLEFAQSNFNFKTDIPFQTQIASASVTALCEGKENELWVGTYDGIFRYDTDKGLFDYFDMADGLSGDAIKCIYKDADGSLWIGIRGGGINRFDNGIFRNVDSEMVLTPTAFVRDAKNKMWVGTEGNGMLILNKEEKILAYDEDDGLMSNNIRSLALDGFGNVWVGTNKGANEWRASEGRFIKYSGQSGFVGLEAKLGAAWKDSDGDLWFGTSDGAIKVGAQENEAASDGPMIVIHGLSVDSLMIEESEGLSFDHNSRDFVFEYGAVSLRDPAAVFYQLRLQGLNDKWTDAGRSTAMSYPIVPAGNYTFQVRAVDRSGVWSEPASLSFTVNPPWWQRWWAIASALLVLTAGIVFYNRYRSKRLKMRNQILERRVKERTAEVVEQGVEIEKQKVRVEELLLNILPKNISEELSESGEAKARSHDDVTVMFTDMKGFTQVAEQMSPEDLVNELHKHFGKFDDVTGKLGLEKIKTIGDSYMAACGIPDPDENHALKTVLAALEIRELMRDWQLMKQKAGEIHWSLRIGIHSGPVVAGVVGKKKFAYDIWGDTVNTASRMESSGAPDKLNVSKATWDAVESFVVGEYRGKVKAKNKGEVDMYFIERLRPEFSLTSLGLRPNNVLLDQLGLKKVSTQKLA